MPKSEVSLATVRSVCEKKGAIPILRCLDRSDVPLRMSEIVGISGVSYETADSVLYRLVEAGFLSLHKTVFDKRVRYFEIENEQALKQVLTYFEKHNHPNESGTKVSGEPEEV